MPLPLEFDLSEVLPHYCMLTQALLQAAQGASWEEVVALCEQRSPLEQDLLAAWQRGQVGTAEHEMLTLALRQSQQAEDLMRVYHEELSKHLAVTRQASRLGHTYLADY